MGQVSSLHLLSLLISTLASYLRMPCFEYPCLLHSPLPLVSLVYWPLGHWPLLQEHLKSWNIFIFSYSTSHNSHLCFSLFFFLSFQLLYNIVVVFAIRWHESVIYFNIDTKHPFKKTFISSSNLILHLTPLLTFVLLILSWSMTEALPLSWFLASKATSTRSLLFSSLPLVI